MRRPQAGFLEPRERVPETPLEDLEEQEAEAETRALHDGILFGGDGVRAKAATSGWRDRKSRASSSIRPGDTT